MTLDDLPFDYPTTPANPAAVAKRCYRHDWHDDYTLVAGQGIHKYMVCSRCGVVRDEAAAKRGRNNRVRGGKAELVVARKLAGGEKVGPLGLPWDVVIPGYARIQVRKYKTPESLRKIAAELRRIGPGAEMPGYVWIEPGRDGEQLITFRLSDFAERHGEMTDAND